MFFAAFALATFFVSIAFPEYVQARKWTHAGLGPVVVVIWAVFGAICFFTIPSSFFSGFFQLARVLAAIFLLFQVIVLIDFVYMLNDKLLSRDECVGLLVALTFALLGLGVAGIVIAYVFFAPSSACSLNIFFITFTLLLGVIVCALSTSSWRPESVGLPTAAMMFSYCVYILISALYSLPRDLPCSPTPAYGTTTWNTVLGFIVSVVAMVISIVRMGHDTRPFFYHDSLAEANDEELPYSAPVFHLVFALATCYFLMLFTNWHLVGSPGHFTLDVGTISTWMKIATQWICYGAYAWTLVAPKICANRDFGH